MKIFIASSCGAAHNKECGGALYNNVAGVSLALRPDSALARHAKPFFVPDHLGRIEARAALAARISRLGKSIATRFATRYYDALTPAVAFTAADMEQRLRAEDRPPDMAAAFDSSVIVGDWTLREDIPSPTLWLGYNGAEWTDLDYSGLQQLTEAAIAEASRLCTLKTGDIILALAPCPAMNVKPGDSIEGRLGGGKRLGVECR